MDLQQIAHIIDIVGRENAIPNSPMSRHTTFKVGGPAELYVTPENQDQIRHVWSYCLQNSIDCMIIGNGSNLLVRDGGIPGVVMDLSAKFNEIVVEGNVIRAQAGALLSRVARAAAKNSLTGMEFAEGIPGTIGGAIYMNAGAYGGEMSQITEGVRCLRSDGTIVLRDREQHGFSYRHSVYMSSTDIILEAELQLRPGDPQAIEDAMEDLRGRRRDKQPTDKPSAGSTFKRPANGYAAAMIDQCGLKGSRVGGAEVSTKHSGFIINTGNATATDVLQLMDRVADVVESQFGVTLEPEVRIVGIDRE